MKLASNGRAILRVLGTCFAAITVSVAGLPADLARAQVCSPGNPPGVPKPATIGPGQSTKFTVFYDCIPANSQQCLNQPKTVDPVVSLQNQTSAYCLTYAANPGYPCNATGFKFTNTPGTVNPTSKGTVITLTLEKNAATPVPPGLYNVVVGAVPPYAVCNFQNALTITGAKMPPTIYYYGAAVTNSTQTVMLGQLIQLTTEPVISGQTQSWTVDDETVGGYNASDARGNGTGMVLPTDFTQSNTNFYWTTVGTKHVTYTVNYPSAPQYTAKVTFKVQGPTHASVAPKLGSVQIYSPKPLLFALGLGNITTLSPGIVFTETGTTAAETQWVQLITQDKYTPSFVLGGQNSCTTTPNGTALDTEYPYNHGPQTSVNDSPNLPLQGTWSKVQTSTSFQMFLMWQASSTTNPANAQTIPVPLGYVSWSWSGGAVRTGVASWTCTDGEGPVCNSKDSTKSAKWNPGSTFPQWTYVAGSGVTPTCTQ